MLLCLDVRIEVSSLYDVRFTKSALEKMQNMGEFWFGKNQGIGCSGKSQQRMGDNIRFCIIHVGQNLRNGFHPIVIEYNYQASIYMPINISFFSLFLSIPPSSTYSLHVYRINVAPNYIH